MATRWLDLVREALNELAAQDVRLRHAVPPGGQRDVEAGLRELLPAVAATARAEAAVDRLRAIAAARRRTPVVPGRFAELDALADGERS